jgi:hypothetical protein
MIARRIYFLRAPSTGHLANAKIVLNILLSAAISSHFLLAAGNNGGTTGPGNGAGGPPPPLPVVTSAGSVFGGEGIQVIITGTNLGYADTVKFGDTATTAFTYLSEGTITVTPPAGSPGSTVSVSAWSNGQSGGTTATYSYPIGSMRMMGPLYGLTWDDYNNQQYDGWNGNAYHFDVPAPVLLRFPNGPPSFYVNIEFDGSNIADGSVWADSPLLIMASGNTGTYNAALQYCAPLDTKPLDPLGGEEGDPCTMVGSNSAPGKWIDVNQCLPCAQPVPYTTATLVDAGPGKATLGVLSLYSAWSSTPTTWSIPSASFCRFRRPTPNTPFLAGVTDITTPRRSTPK